MVMSESQNICFINNKKYIYFIKKYTDPLFKNGQITNINGKILGEHTGISNFTVGQRRGLNCPDKRPYYVLNLNKIKNTVIVGYKKKLLVKNCFVKNIIWSIYPFKKFNKLKVQIRYKNLSILCNLILIKNNIIKLEFDILQFAVAPGQIAVFYNKKKIIGSGFII
jgi:tRNA-specific 2-thiouridylase